MPYCTDEVFVDFDKYDEDTAVEVKHYQNGKRISYYTATKKHYFPFADYFGKEEELLTEVEINYKVIHGTFNPREESDWDYLGYSDVVSWEILSVTDSTGDEIEPKEVLTADQLLDYTTDLDNFIGG